jgi:glycosyltransferase involved in cell wall biosynthesis
VHDVVALRRPKLYAPRSVRIAKAQARIVRDRADLVLTTCEATKADIVELLRIDPDRVVVAPLGHRPPPVRALAPAVKPPYVLYVGAVTPRKGLRTLAGALGRLGGDAPPLVVAGPDGWRAEALHAVLPSGTRVLGRVDDETLDRLLDHATVLCHPSEAEGFGLPVLEAMAAGVPVVAADIPPVREVAGDAAVLVAPGNEVELAGALGALLADRRRRAELSAAGRARASAYTWDACAAATADAYRALAISRS